MPRTILVGLLLAATLACREDAKRPYDTPIRSSGEVRAELDSACQASIDRGGPMLIEFSAPWCTDCLRLHEMKQDADLATELARWPVVVINVGHFDQHTDLLGAFGVENIAHWALLSPEDCGRPIETWPRIAHRKLEPVSGEARNTSSDDLAEWLEAFRDR